MRLGVLFRNEMIKLRGRAAFWVAFLSFGTILTLVFGSQLYQSVKGGKPPAPLSEAWGNIFLGSGPMPAFIAGVALILLVASEFSWRTARQNVIDGLSKTQWFTGKLLLLPFLMAAFLGLQIVIGAGCTVAAAGVGEAGEWITGHDLAALGGSALALMGIGSMAYLIAFTARSSGPAIGLFFLYLAIVENIAHEVLRRFEAVAAAARYLPGKIFMQLLESVQYYPEVLSRMIEAAEKAERAAPSIPDTTALVLVASAYTVIFLAAAFIVHHRRDL